jgi:hypothetical protein|tara:strand:- start:1473 stop:1808 length:336 start_codon:yes stop_codon:yes gene_type:complete
MPNKLILMGLIKPNQDAREAFEQWYLGNHVEDTFNCPNISAVRCLKAVRGYLGDAPGEYLTIYEFEGDDAVEAERILENYQADPNAWHGLSGGSIRLGNSVRKRNNIWRVT